MSTRFCTEQISLRRVEMQLNVISMIMCDLTNVIHWDQCCRAYRSRFVCFEPAILRSVCVALIITEPCRLCLSNAQIHQLKCYSNFEWNGDRKATNKWNTTRTVNRRPQTESMHKTCAYQQWCKQMSTCYRKYRNANVLLWPQLKESAMYY